MSHELRTPLTVLKGVAELLQRGSHPPETAEGLLERLVVNADRLDPVTVEVAPVKVERIVTNLVTNAVIHTPAATPITVTLSAEPDGALVTVSDRGDGIPPVEREQIFGPFHQGGTAPAHRPGTGIGLSLVTAFAQLHGGRVWVEDTPGGGTTFRVLLPGRDR